MNYVNSYALFVDIILQSYYLILYKMIFIIY